ncbi:hypothetical protein N8I77_012560 [Diaporthe amygdali]|uniref:Uncharacterized protein n=1 Tax=Phomopsis amygdali TaxID=1214568 RepID=A0AAD9S2X8_PHOAM|nr:uncharacterized protein J7T55_013916 [Diaporthe amygdali]KAJ0119713.1 hypothetical protein J7T55_013916 [Diaporthe amygdali]KAK2597798.1 hypothetical protein N8I77_012560 [Diaporthe amygdali]
MTTNSYGSALPKFDYPSIQPAVTRASRLKALPLSARIVSVAAAAGLAFYARPLIQQQRELHASRKSAEAARRPSPAASVYVPWDYTGPGRTPNL